MRPLRTLATMMLLLALTPVAAGAVSRSTVDTFENGTEEGWFAGLLGSHPPVPPHVVQGGGAGGSDDSFLEITAQGGIGPGSRLTAINMSQWAGDYVAEDISTIELDLKNLGTTDLTIRLLISSPTATAVTRFGAFLPAGSLWTHAAFSIEPGALKALSGTVSGALSGATQLRIVHNPLPVSLAPAVAGRLGVDNVRAIPEPGLVIFMGGALIVAAVLMTGYRSARRRVRRSRPLA